MVWCSSCAENHDLLIDGGFLCCSGCGKVINQDNFSNEPTFVKNAAGQSQLAGNRVKTVQSDCSASHGRILKNAFDDMNNLARGLELGIEDNTDVLNPAEAFYKIALERNFTRGRRRELVEAACLYIACREQKRPVLLIDLSDYLKINVYVLGSTFLQLCKLLSLEEHPIVQKPVDPSLFIHRFANRLVGDNYMGITKTALRVIASMNRDWMQTGRKPSGLCGAALYVAALSHGYTFSKSEIVRIVHVCEATLTKRLIEFENTKSGSLTIEEFNKRAEELERECGTAKQPNNGFKACGMNELLCEHKGSGKAPFAHGLCKSCYDDFIKLSGGLDGGSDPPAFQQAERKRMTKECVVDDSSGSSFVIVPCQGLKNSDQDLDIPDASGNETLQFTKTGAATNHEAVNDDIDEILLGVDGTNNNVPDLSESLSDIDDIEVDGYLHNEEEKHYKKIIWEEMNREYIQEQEAKEAAAAAAKKAYEAKFLNCPEEMQAAQDLAAAASAAVAKSRKERQQKRAAEARNSTPAQTAAEATRQMLTKKAFYLKRTQPRVQILIEGLLGMVLEQICYIECLRNFHVFRQINHISIVVDLLQNLRLQLVVSTSWETFPLQEDHNKIALLEYLDASMLRLSSKINFDVLEKLFDESVVPENPKKSRIESHSDNDDKPPKDTSKVGGLGPEDEYENAGDDEQAYDGNFYDENVEEGYGYDDDYGYDGL